METSFIADCVPITIFFSSVLLFLAKYFALVEHKSHHNPPPSNREVDLNLLYCCSTLSSILSTDVKQETSSSSGLHYTLSLLYFASAKMPFSD